MQDGRLLLGPAMRIDLVIDMKGEPGRRYRIIDDFYEGLGYGLTRFAYSDDAAAADRGHRTRSGCRPTLCLNRLLPVPNVMS